MTRDVFEADSAIASSDGRLAISANKLAALGLIAQTLLILAVSIVTGAGYHFWAYGDAGPVNFYLGAGALAALIYVLPYVMVEHCRIHDFLEGRRTAARGFLVWNYTFLCLGLFAFMTKSTDDYSRGWVALFYVAGLVCVITFEAAFARFLSILMASQRIALRRMMLVGDAEDIAVFCADEALRSSGVRIVATMALPGAGERSALELETAVAKARALGVGDVVVLSDWARVDLIQRVVAAFSSLPVEIHLGASSLIGKFTEARVSRLASLTTLSLTAPALGPLQSMVKRTVDVLVSALALLLLSPLFALIGLLIKLDSPGPVFFRQRRSGFNQNEFVIWKFRTMSTLDDGHEIVQARPKDERVTHIGRYLRRYNLDELPQLFNVLRGEMSLVGPRPHAVAHDRLYGEMIPSYVRRLNVLPGITGWAQVNGARGPTLNEADMRDRVALDLYYIENWSVTLDLYILALTIVSPKAFRNAF